MHWSVLKVAGPGPCARRRQFCCLVGDRVFLFGGTRSVTQSLNQFYVIIVKLFLYIMVYYIFLIRVCDNYSATWHFYY